MGDGSRKNLSDNNTEVKFATIAINRAMRIGHSLEKLRVNTSSKELYNAATDLLAKW